jgi:hypothetical protein
MDNENQTEIKPAEPVEKQDVVVEVTGFQLELELFKGL